MNHRILYLFCLCMPVILLLAGCQSKAKAGIPITGAQEISLSARAELARDHALEYVLSSSRLANMPPRVNWQLEVGEPSANEYRFRNGDWLMLIRLPGGDSSNQKVILINPVEQASWSGYITAEGRVVDTTYGR